MKRTKIVATIGPATESQEKIAKLIKAGVDVFRLNFSHGERDTHRRVFDTIRKAAEKLGTHTAILQDLQGPKMRVGKLAGGVMQLGQSQEVTVTTRDVIGGDGLIPITYKPLPREVKPLDRILLDDGLLELRVKSASGQNVRCKVIKGGMLKDHKGINLPDIKLSTPSLTPKDEEDLKFGLALGVDFVALSFVRTGDCVRKLREKIAGAGADVRVIAKIERPEAVQNIEEILAEADGVMVARGDLGVEMPPEKVPGIQKHIVERANAGNKVVIIATQMLESMIGNPRPTRAEASDVANAVLDGTDAVMLSGETAVGKYPVEAVSMMSRIVAEAESGDSRRAMIPANPPHEDADFTQAVAHAAARAAEDLNAKVIVAFTHTGNTALLISKTRPAPLVIGATLNERLARRMALTWGVTPMLFRKVNTAESLVAEVDKRLLATHLVKKGDIIVITFGVPVGRPGTSDLIKIHRMGKKD